MCGLWQLTPPRFAGTVRRPRREVRASRKGGTAFMSLVNALIASISQDEEGQGLAEYALILALIAIVAIVALIFLGSQVSTILHTVATSV
jgi:pilus assembly protein Flp/PilA